MEQPLGPGEVILDALEELQISVLDFSKMTMLRHEHLCKILTGESEVTEEIAEILDFTLGGGSAYWLRLERSYRLAIKTKEQQSLRNKILTGYSWIKVKRWIDDPNLSWEERFNILQDHHNKETSFLIDFIRKLVIANDGNMASSRTNHNHSEHTLEGDQGMQTIQHP